jgi:hypothetical protein
MGENNEIKNKNKKQICLINYLTLWFTIVKTSTF